jgi:hypothetical protein
MRLAASVAEIEAPIDAILATRSAVLMMTDAERHELSGRYMTTHRIGTTAKEPMAEGARRSRLTAHERIAEAAVRRHLQDAR